MESPDERRRREMLDHILTLPENFWPEVGGLIRSTYSDAFEDVRTDPMILDSQRPDKLLQERAFRCEQVLATAAERNGLTADDQLLAVNGRHIVYISNESVGITQAYVAPNAGRCATRTYRARRASVNDVWEFGQISLFSEDEERRQPKLLYGIVSHSPLAKAFETQAQMLGAIQLVVPRENMEAMEIFSFEEISAEYRRRESERARLQPSERRAPVWKSEKDKKEE